MDFSNGLLWYMVFLLSTSCHEAAHAWAALQLGDDTAYQGGQVSLNPWPHIRRSPIGMVVAPLASFLMGGFLLGWASAPYNVEWSQKYPRRAALMALAGPAANITLALIAGALLRLGLGAHFFTRIDWITTSHLVAADAGMWEFAGHALSIGFSLNVLLAIFNLMPVPPLDGSKLPALFLPEGPARKLLALLSSPYVGAIGFFVIMRGIGSELGDWVLLLARHVA